MARTLLRGRIRLSTVLLAVLFAATFTTYLLVRPTPASIVHSRHAADLTPAVVSPTSAAPRSPVPSARPDKAPSPSPSLAPTSAVPVPHPSSRRPSEPASVPASG